MAGPAQLPLVLRDTSESSELDRSLATLEHFLGLLGYCQYTLPRAALAWLAFFLLAVALPLFSLEFSRCSPDGTCRKFEIKTFQVEILVSRAVVAAISLLCVSRNLRKYGMRKALFVDRSHGNLTQFRKQYIQKIRSFYCWLATWFGICFLLKSAREIVRLMYLHKNPWWSSVILFFAILITWSYTTLVFLSGCALFNLVGDLQVIHFENFGKVLERDMGVSVYVEEHMNLTCDLSKVSHRFRIFLILEFLFITASQFVTLLQTTENQSFINLINGGDFGVLSIVQLVAISLCLGTASKISHRAQSLGGVASRWHAVVTCNSNDALGSEISDNAGNSESFRPVGSFAVSYSESDLESSVYMPQPTNAQFISSPSSYNKRQAFVTYVQNNTGGFTLFGYIVDRTLMNTIFFIELSLAFFVLGKTIIVTVN